MRNGQQAVTMYPQLAIFLDLSLKNKKIKSGKHTSAKKIGRKTNSGLIRAGILSIYKNSGG